MHIPDTLKKRPFKNKTKFVKQIGRGQYAIVEKHLDANLQPVAVKIQMNYNSLNHEILCELNALERLKGCSHIAQLLGVDISTNGLNGYDELMIVTKFLMSYHRRDLRYIIDKIDVITRVELVSMLMSQMFQALYHLYEAGLIHTDIKPDNILISGEKLYLADFGLAFQLPCDHKARHVLNIVRVSPLYLAPELLKSTKKLYFSTKVDMWSTGITFMEFLTKNCITDLPNFYGDFDEARPHLINRINSFSIDGHIDVEKHLKNQIDFQIYDLLENYNLGDEINIQDLMEILPSQIQKKIHDQQPLEEITQIVSEDVYHMIPKQVVVNLTNMLYLDPKDRINVVDIPQKFNECHYNKIIPTGDIKQSSTFDMDLFYRLVLDPNMSIIDFCIRNKLKATTCYLIIDLFERYLHNYDITKNDDINCVVAVLIMTAARIHESDNLRMKTIIDYFDMSFTDDEYLKVQNDVFQKFRYLFTTCETDEQFYILNEHNYMVDDQPQFKYTVLSRLYELMYTDNKYSGAIGTLEWHKYYKRAADEYEY